jgi:ribosomal protein L29
MKSKDIKELKDKPKVELEKMLHESRADLRKAMFDLNAGKLQNVRTLRVFRKQIARLMTFISASEEQNAGKPNFGRAKRKQVPL